MIFGKHLAHLTASEKEHRGGREGGAKRTEGSCRGPLWGLRGGTDLDQAQIDKGTNGRAGSRASRVGSSLCLLAPQRHLGAEHAPSKRWPRRGPSVPFRSFPHPANFPTHPHSFFFLCLLFPVQRFSQRGPRGSGQNDWFEESQVKIIHSPASLAPPPPLTPLDGTGGSWIGTGVSTPRSEERARGAAGHRVLARASAGLRLMKRGTVPLRAHPLGPAFSGVDSTVTRVLQA